MQRCRGEQRMGMTRALSPPEVAREIVMSTDARSIYTTITEMRLVYRCCGR